MRIEGAARRARTGNRGAKPSEAGKAGKITPFYATQSKTLLVAPELPRTLECMEDSALPPLDIAAIALPLFAPADRPDRFAKALASGADAVIFDLEDAVAATGREAARVALNEAAPLLRDAPCPVWLRVNAAGTPDHDADLALAGTLPLAGVMLAKAERVADIERVGETAGCPVVALVETAAGLAKARDLARAAGRLAFGSIDYAADLGSGHTREALLLARLELVLASRLAGRAGPIDGVTTAVREAAPVEDDMRYAASLGFAGKLLIHPAQIAPARAAFRPEAGEIDWARRVLQSGDGAVAIDGAMVDAPVRLRAHAILRRAGATQKEPAA